MKNKIISIGTALFLLGPVVGRADPGASDQEIVTQRGQVLERIVSRMEERLGLGTGSPEAVGEARIALYTFHRDLARESTERVRWQKAIVDERAKFASALEKGGIGLPTDPIAVLRAQERLLEAKQVLAEMGPSTAE